VTARLGEIAAQHRLVRRARDHADPLAGDGHVHRLGHRAGARHREAGGQAEIRPREGISFAVLRGHGRPRDQRLALSGLHRRVQFLPRQALDLAARGDGKLAADRPRQLDIEAGEAALPVEEVEGREVDRGQEANAPDAGKVGLGQPLLLVPERGNRRSLRPRVVAGREPRRGEEQNEDGEESWHHGARSRKIRRHLSRAAAHLSTAVGLSHRAGRLRPVVPLSGAAGFKACSTRIEARRGENRAVPDASPANGSRLGGRSAPLAGMTMSCAPLHAIALPEREGGLPIEKNGNMYVTGDGALSSGVFLDRFRDGRHCVVLLPRRSHRPRSPRPATPFPAFFLRG
jgi:hypothetical protein